MNKSSDDTKMEFTNPKNSTPEAIGLYCGEMDEDFADVVKCQYWCEGVLFSVVGGIGLLGNLISIFVLLAK